MAGPRTPGAPPDGTPEGTAPAATPSATLPPLEPPSHRLSLTWHGQERDYLLDVPTGYRPDGPTPLVLVFHGSRGSASGIRSQSRMDLFAERSGYLVAYPDQVHQADPPDPDTDTRDDLGFVRAVVDQLVEEWHAAPGRVYAAGFSLGATVSYRVAIEASDLFAAVAPVSGVPPRSWEGQPPESPMSVVSVIGTDDSLVDGVGTTPWRRHLGCRTTTGPVADAPHVTRLVASCPDGSEVVEHRVGDMRHEWPDPEHEGIGANPLIADFFAGHARDPAPSGAGER